MADVNRFWERLSLIWCIVTARTIVAARARWDAIRVAARALRVAARALRVAAGPLRVAVVRARSEELCGRVAFLVIIASRAQLEQEILCHVCGCNECHVVNHRGERQRAGLNQHLQTSPSLPFH